MLGRDDSLSQWIGHGEAEMCSDNRRRRALKMFSSKPTGTAAYCQRGCSYNFLLFIWNKNTFSRNSGLHAQSFPLDLFYDSFYSVCFLNTNSPNFGSCILYLYCYFSNSQGILTGIVMEVVFWVRQLRRYLLLIPVQVWHSPVHPTGVGL